MVKLKNADSVCAKCYTQLLATYFYLPLGRFLAY